MNKLVCVLFLLIGTLVYSQEINKDDFGRIVLNSFIPKELNIPNEAKEALKSKLDQISSSNGLGGNQINPRFIITANIVVGTKDIIAGPPQMIAQNLGVTLFIGDAISNIILSNLNIELKGVGTNENKAIIDAIKNINPKNNEVVTFLEEGKSKIINYYSTNCDFILKEAQALTKQEKYEEAIYKLSLVPDVCKECYFKCLDTLSLIYQKKIDADCKIKLNKATNIWNANQNLEGAEKSGDLLSTINPQSNCQIDVNTLMKTIDAKLKADEKARWQFKMKQYQDNIELEKININAYKEVAVEFARNLPRTVTYNNIYWR